MKTLKSLLAVLLIFTMLFAVGCSNDKVDSNVQDEDEVSSGGNKKDSQMPGKSPSAKTPDDDDAFDDAEKENAEDIGENSEENTEENSEGNVDTSNLPEIPGVDLAYEIEYFVSTPFNTQTLKVGEGHTPSAAGWTQVGGLCYTTDESVVEVAKNGNVFARGVGTAYVVITGIGGMYDICKYEVVG